MLLFKENLPDVYKKTRWWLNTKDYVYGHLTGRFGQTDYSDAALTIAMDINRKVWAEDLIKSLGLSMEQMPKILVGHDVRGQTTRDVYRRTGLIAGTPVAIGGGDAACTARGAGVFEPGSSYTYIGSSAWVSQLMKRPVLDPEARIFNFLDMDGESCHICGTVQCGAAAFDWARANLLGCMEQKDLADISRIENMARQSRPGAEGVMFLPTLMGSRTPYWDANTRGILMGFTLYHDRRHIARAVYEAGSRCDLGGFIAIGDQVLDRRLFEDTFLNSYPPVFAVAMAPVSVLTRAAGYLAVRHAWGIAQLVALSYLTLSFARLLDLRLSLGCVALAWACCWRK
jgi:xylulokinase